MPPGNTPQNDTPPDKTLWWKQLSFNGRHMSHPHWRIPMSIFSTSTSARTQVHVLKGVLWGPSPTCLPTCTSTRLSMWQYHCWTTCHSFHYCWDNLQGTREHSIQTLWGHWVNHILLIALNPPWYVKRQHSDTGTTNGTFLIYTSTSMGHPAHHPYFQQVEITVSCVMTHYLTQPPTILQLQWLSCHLLHSHHCIIRWRHQLKTTVFSPFEHYKNPIETGLKYTTLTALSFTLSQRVPTHFGIWHRFRRVCPDD